MRVSGDRSRGLATWGLFTGTRRLGRRPREARRPARPPGCVQRPEPRTLPAQRSAESRAAAWGGRAKRGRQGSVGPQTAWLA